MSKAGVFLKRYVPAPALTFVGGLLASTVVTALFGHIVRLTADLLAVLGIVFIVISVSTLMGLRQELRTLLQESKLSARVVRSGKGKDADAELYDAITDCLVSATNSIHAVSLFRPATLEITEARRKYYKRLDDLLREQDTVFSYHRIVQVESIYEEELRDDQTDAATFAHCERCLALHKDSTARIYLKQTKNNLGSLSFFVIDSKQVVFVIPSGTDRSRDSGGMPVASVVIFTDAEGSLVREMLSLYEDLAHDSNARRITKCVRLSQSNLQSA
jgi:hypothetical protein